MWKDYRKYDSMTVDEDFIEDIRDYEKYEFVDKDIVEDIINKLSITTYINLIEGAHSVAYCKAVHLNDNLKRRYVKWIAGESRYSVQIHI